MKLEGLHSRGVNEDVDADVGAVGAVAAFQQVHSVVRLETGSDVHCKCLTNLANETAIHRQRSSSTIKNDQIAACCNATHHTTLTRGLSEIRAADIND